MQLDTLSEASTGGTEVLSSDVESPPSAPVSRDQPNAMQSSLQHDAWSTSLIAVRIPQGTLDGQLLYRLCTAHVGYVFFLASTDPFSAEVCNAVSIPSCTCIACLEVSSMTSARSMLLGVAEADASVLFDEAVTTFIHRTAGVPYILLPDHIGVHSLVCVLRYLLSAGAQRRCAAALSAVRTCDIHSAGSPLSTPRQAVCRSSMFDDDDVVFAEHFDLDIPLCDSFPRDSLEYRWLLGCPCPCCVAQGSGSGGEGLFEGSSWRCGVLQCRQEGSRCSRCCLVTPESVKQTAHCIGALSVLRLLHRM